MNDAFFSLNLVHDLQSVFQYAFMRNAFEAGTAVALIAGIVGYFVVLRRSSFAAHALSHIGFAGAAGAVLAGINPIFGLLFFTSGGGVVMALLGRRAASRDVEIGTVLAFMLGLGALFVSLYNGYAAETYSLLFGQVLGISGTDVSITVVAAVLILIAIGAVYRPLLFSSLDEETAEARGLSLTVMNIVFMLLVAIATSIAVQIVGILLIFALMITPAAIAERIATRPLAGMAISAAIALAVTWIGLFVAFYLPYPVSFFIVTGVFALYLFVRAFQPKTEFVEP